MKKHSLFRILTFILALVLFTGEISVYAAEIVNTVSGNELPESTVSGNVLTEPEVPTESEVLPEPEEPVIVEVRQEVAGVEESLIQVEDEKKKETAKTTQNTKTSKTSAAKKAVSPSRPVIISLKSYSYGKATVKWEKISGVDDFVVQYSTDSEFSSGVKTKKVNDTTSNKTTVSGLKGNKTYYFRVKSTVPGGTKKKPKTISSKYSKVKSVKIKGEVKPTADSAKITTCKIVSGTRDGGITISFKATLKDRLKSADKKYYIVQTASYGTEIDVKTPCTEVDKEQKVSVKFQIKGSKVDRALMNKFALAVKKSDGTYQLVSAPKGISNPEYISENTAPILKPVSKKGLQGIGYADAKDTNSKHTLFNLDLAKVVGTRAKSGYVPYEYKGKTYYFSDCSNLVGEIRQLTEGYEQHIQGATGKNNQVAVTMNILLSYNSTNKYLIDPAARKVGYRYYTLNVREEKARETLEAVFLYLGEIFGQEECYVTNWILGNEVNSSNAYNYAGTLSQNQYIKCYAAVFRLLYNGVKAAKTGNNICISLDNGWCAAPDTYTGKSTLDKFASYAQKENSKMLWSIAYHGYSYPLTRNDFWNDSSNTTNSTSTRYISMKNISVLTKYAASLEKKYEKPTGSIRVILSEQGYNAKKGEYSQAKALARGYYIAEFNSRIDAFIIRAIQDAKEEVRGDLHLGIKDLYEQKRTSYYVYEYMDSNLSRFKKKEASQSVSSVNISRFKDAQKILCKTDWESLISGFKESKLNGMY